MTQLYALISSIRNDDEGQGLAEYALILALIAIVAIVALIFLGTQVSGILNTVGSSVSHSFTRTKCPRRLLRGLPLSRVGPRSVCHAHEALSRRSAPSRVEGLTMKNPPV